MYVQQFYYLLQLLILRNLNLRQRNLTKPGLFLKL